MTTLTKAPEAPVELSDSARAFQLEVREWLEANAPAELKGLRLPRYRTSGEVKRLVEGWTERLADAGFMCVAWPKEYGGRGLSGVEVALLNEEFHRAELPRMTRGMGEGMVGPAIIAHGTEEQKAYFLPRIIAGQDRYCQGFSEPNAGSDLASLRTRGVLDGDDIVVNGQKVWTSWFWDATMMFCLCRTDPSAPKHKGISYVLIPIQSDGKPNGIEFRPIKQMSGEGHFAETFITDARAPQFNIIGGLNNGWSTAMTTLANERGGGATTQHTAFQEELSRLVDDARRLGKLNDPRVREQLAWAHSNVEIMRYSGLLMLNALAAGRDPGPGGAASVTKIRWSEYERRLGEIALDILGPEALVTAGDDYQLAPWQQTFLQTRTHTIWGGTAEIQRNIIAERVLGLPKEPGA
ncbi:MAG TPA: acyl-CoA dehydrogenase family protein [Candidatus Solibacter sp.]|jgi:alkylation response protein AidB-like acyl-CoA dehydrogenase|nr:acyl-CoA dehydrogenase family protein [Candidatus Solibacter sp.]